MSAALLLGLHMLRLGLRAFLLLLLRTTLLLLGRLPLLLHLLLGRLPLLLHLLLAGLLLLLLCGLLLLHLLLARLLHLLLLRCLLGLALLAIVRLALLLHRLHDLRLPDLLLLLRRTLRQLLALTVGLLLLLLRCWVGVYAVLVALLRAHVDLALIIEIAWIGMVELADGAFLLGGDGTFIVGAIDRHAAADVVILDGEVAIGSRLAGGDCLFGLTIIDAIARGLVGSLSAEAGALDVLLKVLRSAGGGQLGATVVDGCKLSTVLRRQLLMLNLGVSGLEVTLTLRLELLLLGASQQTVGSAVITDVAVVVVHDVYIADVDVVNIGYVDVVDLAVVEEAVAIPIAALIATAAIAEPIVDAAIESDMRSPVAGIKAVGVVFIPPIGGGPEIADGWRFNPDAGDPEVAILTISPVARSP